MLKIVSRFILLQVVGIGMMVPAAGADIEWSGIFRIEGYSLNNPELGGKRRGDSSDRPKRELNYGLTHLVLRPKIVAGDGLTINGQFDIFNSGGYPSSTLGQTFGSGVDVPAGADRSAGQSRAFASNQKPETLQVTQLFLTLDQEFGSLIVGRAPLQFGLGITHNAGRGLFDHWYDTDDLVGYKIVVGNLWFLPMIGKSSEGELNLNSDDVTDYMIQMQYENPETDIELGVFYQARTAGKSDAPTLQGDDANGTVIGGPGAVSGSKMNMKTVNIYALKDAETYRLGMEASFQSGETGVITNSGNGDNVTLGGFGIGTEFEYRPKESKWKWGLKAGLASGDDPTTSAKFDGFIFDRNYDVAMLMFNHPLGADDFLRSRLVTGPVRSATTKDINVPDVEGISNVLYVAPRVTYRLSDRWNLENTIVAGFLNTNPMTGGTDPGKDLGYEWDISVNFAPRKGVLWINQAGLLFPGKAWKGGGQYDSEFAYGLATKAAISF